MKGTLPGLPEPGPAAGPGAVRLSVVVPTLNEEDRLGDTVAALRAGVRGPARPERSAEGLGGGPGEIVVADSGSRDGTVAQARRLGARVVEAPPGGLPSRATACNRGAAAARGGVLLFLDADVGLPVGWDRAVAAALDDPSVVGGGFELTLEGPEPALRHIERINRLRYRRSRLFYGDQGVFVRAADFRAVGGFPEVPVMESALLCRALKRRGRLALVDLPVAASARRFRAGGIGRVFLQDLWIWLRWTLRLGPGRLGEGYWRHNRL